MYILISYFAFLFFVYKRTLFYGLFFQQERYSTKSFLHFIFHKFQLIDKKLSLILFLYTIIATGTKNYLLDICVTTVLYLIFAITTPNPFSISWTKQKLSLTNRMKRIFEIAFILDLIIASSLFYYAYSLPSYCFCEIAGYLIFTIQLLPFSLIIANLFLSPVELFVRHKYIAEAKSKLDSCHPIVIGITGSFGKTSTKNILNHILSSVSSSMTTARSINTIMGITKVIREELKPSYKYFIVEIGTSSKGKISKICRLVKPKYGILTAIGTAHLENFKTQDAIAREKFDMIKSIIRNDGAYIINPYLVDNKYLKKFNAIPTDFQVDNLLLNLEGIKFTLTYEKKSYEISAPIYGLHQAQNISMAFIMAVKLGLSPTTIIASLKSLPQTEHRLEVKKSAGFPTIIDDAFNSNISGFKSALNTLHTLSTEQKGRAILITPGMVELGSQHDAQHIEVAKCALSNCDIVIAVVPDRIRAFIDTFAKGKSAPQELILVNTLKEAQNWVSLNAKSKDVILYENDLPDVFEAKINI